MKKLVMVFGLLVSVSSFANSMKCVAHGLRSGATGVQESVSNMNKYGHETVSLSDKLINGYALAIEMGSESSNENSVFPLTKIAKDGTYSIYSINDRYGFLCIKL